MARFKITLAPDIDRRLTELAKEFGPTKAEFFRSAIRLLGAAQEEISRGKEVTTSDWHSQSSKPKFTSLINSYSLSHEGSANIFVDSRLSMEMQRFALAKEILTISERARQPVETPPADEVIAEIFDGPRASPEPPNFDLATIIESSKRIERGLLVRTVSEVWLTVARMICLDWGNAYQVPSEKWEEIIAGAFKRSGYDEVILTPRSGDFGRDVIATKWGVGSIKVLGSVKAYAPGNLVRYDSIRALIGVLSGERDASKGMLITTSDFPPRVNEDPYIAPFLPTRVELLNGKRTRQWLEELIKK